MCLWTTSSEDKNGPFRCAESKASKTEGQYGWTSSRAKKHYQRRWKCREVTQEEYKGTAQAWTDAVRKVELSWNWNKLGRGRSARRVSVGTYIYILAAEASGGLQSNEVGKLVMRDVEKVQVLNDLFFSVSTGQVCSQVSCSVGVKQ